MGKEYPKTLHGTSKGEPLTKIVNDEAEEKAARAKGWGDTPKQDHGPTEPDLDADPVLDKPAKAAKSAPKAKKTARKK
jgi:hypothetical protein